MDGHSPFDSPRARRTLTMGEAIARYGSRWERTPDGVSVREQLMTSGTSPENSQRGLMVERAAASLKARRSELERQIAHLKAEMELKDEVIAARFLFRDVLSKYHEDIDDREKRLKDLPEKPQILALDREDETAIPHDGLRVGEAIWLVDLRTGSVSSDRVIGLAFQDNGVRYRTLRGVSALHQVAGLVILDRSGFVAFLREDDARLYLVDATAPRAAVG